MVDGRYDGRDVVKKNRWNGHTKKIGLARAGNWCFLLLFR